MVSTEWGPQDLLGWMWVDRGIENPRWRYGFWPTTEWMVVSIN